MKSHTSLQFLNQVLAGLTQVFRKTRFLIPVLAGAAVVIIQAYTAWAAWRHGVEIPWAGHATALLSTMTALLITLMVMDDTGREDPDQTSIFSVARGLATGYYFNFLQPLVGSLRQAQLHRDQADKRFRVRIDGKPVERLPELRGLLVAIPCDSTRLCGTPADGARQIADRYDGLQRHAIVFDEIRLETGATWSRPIELCLLREKPDGPAVLLDVPTTLHVIHETLSHEPGADGKPSPLQQASERFVQVLNEFRDVVTQVGDTDPLRHLSSLQVHVVQAEVAEHRIRELMRAGI